MEVDLPSAARRLFPEAAAPAEVRLGVAAPEAGAAAELPTVRLDVAAPDSHVLARLLEDGDGADLAWLCRQVSVATLAAWVEGHGGRRLSRRSLAFWSRILGVPGAGEALSALPSGAPSAGAGASAAAAALARRRPLWLL